MKEGDIIPVALELTFRHTKGQSGLIVGLFREFPFIVGQAKTKDELLNNLQKNLELYFNSFPAGLEKLRKYGRIVENGKISGNNIDG
jgi:predicted RNase H-like HicB family nuclease